MRVRQREELNCQIVHDSLHRRPGWTLSYLLEGGGIVLGFGSIAIAGPWKDKPTLFEFYVLPEHRGRAFEIFTVLLAGSGARFFEAQTNDAVLLAMVLTWGSEMESEKIVFHDRFTTAIAVPGASLRCLTPMEEIQQAFVRRQGGGEWILEMAGKEVAKGGILFHYNVPYGDIYMEVAEPYRRRGLGSYLVQELKREAWQLGAIPSARCNTANVASRQTLQKAGFVPFAHILIGSFGRGNGDPLVTKAL